MLFGAFWAVVGILLTEAWVGPLLRERTRPGAEQRLARVHGIVVDDYVEPRDPEALARAGVAGMIESLRDPYASYIGPEEMRSFREESDGTLVGIGAMLGPDGSVLFPLPGGPAEEAGLRPGDRIVAIDGAPSTDWTQREILDALRGGVGSVVALDLVDTGEQPYAVSIERARVPTVTVGDVRLVDPATGIAHLHLRSFARSTVAEFDAALARLDEQGMRALVLDLRYNRGGQLGSAVSVAARLLQGGLVCTLRDRDGSGGRRLADPEACTHPELPVVVLLNGWSASGSEVVAAALRDHGRAAVLGTRSYGKGIYQHVYEDADGGFAIKFTAGYYVTPAGRVLEDHLERTQAGCIEPDVPVALAEGQAAAVQSWLGRNPIPERWFAEVAAHYPELAAEQPPEDRQLDAAVALLHAALDA
jgi:carboxyl-terminal processing protease